MTAKIRLALAERIESWEPWTASGPGWANSGVTAHLVNDYTGERRRETIYRDDLPRDALILFPLAISAYNDLVKIMQSLVVKERETKA